MKTTLRFAFLLGGLPAFALAQNGAATGTNTPHPGSVANPPAVRGINVSPVQRITKDALKGQLTARQLLGKDVYNPDGKKIGEVQDLIPSGAPASSTLRSANPAPAPMGNDRVNAGGNTSGPTSGGGGVSAEDNPRAESSVVISLGGVAGLGATYVSVPFSMLTTDAKGERLTLAIGEAELAQLRAGGNRYPNTTN